jgi:hypothetical protein
MKTMPAANPTLSASPEPPQGRSANTTAPLWLMLIHQLPPQPAYFRVKIWRRLQGLGAVTIKNAVYALPASEETHEDFQWVLSEIRSGGGEGFICEARLIDGLSDDEAIRMFHAARDADYAELATEARQLLDSIGTSEPVAPDRRRQIESQAARLGRRLAEIGKVDFFGAAGRQPAQDLLDEIAARLSGGRDDMTDTAPNSPAGYVGRVWVTRAGLHIDRLASAWLIRRFVDADARFKFVADRNYKPAAGELRFDMFEAEFTHEGELCTFEVLIARLGLDDPALGPVAEIVHDIDLKDGKYGREETAGIDRLILGIAQQHRDDMERIAAGSAVFDGLYEFFRRKQPISTATKKRDNP